MRKTWNLNTLVDGSTLDRFNNETASNQRHWNPIAVRLEPMLPLKRRLKKERRSPKRKA
jgi:hypothetical protein